jgi:hypothetical protein
VRELIDKCIARILFVRTADNNANIYTKNLTEEKHNEHANKNINDLCEQEERNLMVIEAVNDELEGIL